jgi:hypothetical protein
LAIASDITENVFRPRVVLGNTVFIVLRNRYEFAETYTNLSTLATDAAGQLDVLGHDGDTLGVDRAQVSVLEQANEVGLRRLLQSQDVSC